jgi:hypothetical protein
MRSVLSEDERDRIREEIVLRHECEMEMRRKKNRQILPWLLGFLVVLTALACLSGRPW